MPKVPQTAANTPAPRVPLAKPVLAGPPAAPPAPAEDDDALGFHTLEDTIDYANVLYYGPPGSGKTTDAASLANLPGNGKVLVVNTEGGIKKQALAKRGVQTDRVVIWPAPGQRVSKDALETVYRRIKGDLENDPDSWAGVVFDSLSELATILRENATHKRQTGYDLAGRQYDPDLIDVSDYGVQTDHTKRILRRFRDLPCHFIVTALERPMDDNSAWAGMVGPDVNPAVANAVLGYVDIVIRTRATLPDAEARLEDEPPHEFRGATRAGRNFVAKDRFDVLPRVLADPTADRVIAYMGGDLTESDDVLQAEYLARAAERAEMLAAAKAERDSRKRTAKK